MSFPKKGKLFPGQTGGDGKRLDSGTQLRFAVEIAAALHREFGSSHVGIKTVAGWTGANERTTKNWFAGRYGPSGEHLVALARNSNEVLKAFLVLADRQELMAGATLSEAESNLAALLSILQTMRRSST